MTEEIALAAEESPAPHPSLLAPLGVRDFRLIFTGETVSLLGDQFHFIALAWLTLQLTSSGVALGTVYVVFDVLLLILGLEKSASLSI